MNILKILLYSLYLEGLTNRQLFNECIDKVYAGVKFDRKGALIDEMLDRLDNENDLMKQEIKQGIL